MKPSEPVLHSVLPNFNRLSESLSYRKNILYLVEQHATTVIVGETGSGKTTQIPQFLHEAGWTAGALMMQCDDNALQKDLNSELCMALQAAGRSHAHSQGVSRQ